MQDQRFLYRLVRLVHTEVESTYLSQGRFLQKAL